MAPRPLALPFTMTCIVMVFALVWTRSYVAAAPVPSPKHVLFFVIDDYGFADASYKQEMYNGTVSNLFQLIQKAIPIFSVFNNLVLECLGASSNPYHR